MSETRETISDQPFYMDPEYWDGHSIGAPGAEYPEVSRTGRFEAIKAGVALETRLPSLGPNPEPVATYTAGEQLDIERLGRGAMLLFNIEAVGRMHSSPQQHMNRLFELYNMDDQELIQPIFTGRIPQNYTEAAEQLRADVRRSIDLHGELGYGWSNYWGIARVHKGETRVSAVYASHVAPSDPSGSLRIAVTGPQQLFPGVSFEEVGTALTFGASSGDSDSVDQIRRVNKIEVYESGKKAKEKKRKLIPDIGHLASRYSTGVAAA